MSVASAPAPGSPSGAASSEPPRSAGDPENRAVARQWKVDLRELGRRAGSLTEWDRTVPVPEAWGNEMISAPAGAPVELRLRLESVMEGVLVSGEVDVPVTGQCSRCLEPVEDVLELDVQELFAYAGSTTEATSGEDEVRRISGEHLDLMPLVRDTVVLTLPLSPTCTPDCAGLCVDCGERLDDLPADHSHEAFDPRFAGLAARFGTLTDENAESTVGGPIPGPAGVNAEEN